MSISKWIAVDHNNNKKQKILTWNGFAPFGIAMILKREAQVYQNG